MPPYVSRKRSRPETPDESPPPKRSKAAPKPAKRSIFETFDDEPQSARTAEKNRKLLDRLNANDESSLSEADSDDFEDVPQPKRRKVDKPMTSGNASQDEEESDEEDMGWENAMDQDSSTLATPGPSVLQEEPDIADVSISVKDDGTFVQPEVSAGIVKKGPSKRERRMRIHSHCLHVQALMWHNTVRNSWLNDTQVQQSLIDGLSEGVQREVSRWKEAMGRSTKEELANKKRQAATAKQKKGAKGKEKLGGRDWHYDAEHVDVGKTDMSRGDPLFRLLKVLTAYWHKRFTVTAPAIRKQGYRHLKTLASDIKAWQKNKTSAEEHGERVESLKQFRQLAADCEGSRDVGGQLFVALLRGLGLETRMVANLQPVGFGWSKAEEAKPKRKKGEEKVEVVESDSDEDEKKAPVRKTANPARKTTTTKSAKSKAAALKKDKPTRKSARGNKTDPIDLDDDTSSLSSAPEDMGVDDVDQGEGAEDDDDDVSIEEILPPMPKKKKPLKKYDRDLSYPTYWTEVCSPATNKYIPVDPIVIRTIGSSEDLVQSFEPRGKKAEIAKQVIAYAVAFSSDGSAKDVTVRYLKKHQLPGKTKGVRIPAEKIPIYNRKGKVKRYEDYDWFRTVMSTFDRPYAKRSAADDMEDQTDLKPFKPAKIQKEVEKESLQGYKQSAEFILETHLRREEAILPDAEPVKTFTAGKGDKAIEHPVYLRSDVVTCKTVESWHKEGRALKAGEQPLKLVPVRAVTVARKREMEEVLRETGKKMEQGLYSWDQTDWIIPPPIKDGVIPKNAFGSMDVYVPTMVPKGAVHLPLKGSAKLCRRLEIDYAEACTGFEFGKQRAVPVITGVVVAKENEKVVRDAWKVDQAEIKRKEDTKRTAAALTWWRKMVLGLRVIERMRLEYGNGDDGEKDINPFIARKNAPDMAGGFFAPGHDEEEVPQTRKNVDKNEENEFHALAHEDEDIHMEDAGDMGGGFLVEDDDNDEMTHSIETAKPDPVRSVADRIIDLGSDEEGLKPPPSPPKPKSEAKNKGPVTPKKRGSGRKKTTPVKSPYFEHDSAEDEDMDVDEDAMQVVEEVVRPRRTTARTRARK